MNDEFNWKYDHPTTKDGHKPDIVVRVSKGFGWGKAQGYTLKEFLKLLKVDCGGDPKFVKKLAEGNVLLNTYDDYYDEQEEDRYNQMMGY
tara:strand:- start:201 stop:470 length:270 start_codon:yes stop_codon:yes gene_type:complete